MPTRPTRNAPASARNAARGSRKIRRALQQNSGRASSTRWTPCARFAVILDWDTGAVLPKSTAQFREMFAKRASAYWAD